MAGDNSILPYKIPSLGDFQDTIGITRLDSTSADNWNQTIGGLIFQGGLSPEVAVEGSLAIAFNVPFPLKCIGVFLQAIYSPATVANNSSGLIATGSVSTTQFTLINDGEAKKFYWWAVGV